MNDDTQLIGVALARRFARVAVPACPEAAWQATSTESRSNARPRGASRTFAYAAALLAVVAIAGLTAQASSVIKTRYASLVGPLFVSSKPLVPMIHAADRLTIAAAQRRTPFPIIVPAGLPAQSRFLYAAIGEVPNARVVLTYQAHIGSKYYRLAITESTLAAGPPLAHFEVMRRGGTTKRWTVPMRRWKHGAVIMDLFDAGLPPGVSDAIARANTTPSP